MRYLLLSLSVLIFITSCSKDPNKEPSKENYLTSGNWQLNGGSITYKLPYATSPKDTTESVMAILPGCEKDDYLTFQTDYTGFYNSGGNKCSPSDPNQVAFNWSLTNNGNTLNILNAANTFDTSNLVANVTTLNKSTLAINFIMPVHFYNPLDPKNDIIDTFSYQYTYKNIK